jgi:hypothetical protein
LKELIELINKAHSVAILTHSSLDGDALGSSLGIALALDYIGKKVTVFLGEPIPRSLEFLPGQNLISSDYDKTFDLAISLDNSDLKRLGDRADIYISEEKTKSRLSIWLGDTGGETIWTSELQDKNGRIALITLKFELGEWLNGNLTNSLLIREEEHDKRLEEMEMFFRTFFSTELVLTERINCLDEEKKAIERLESDIESLETTPPEFLIPASEK